MARRRVKGQAAMEKVVARVFHVQVRLCGPVGGFGNARRQRVTLHHVPSARDLDVIESGHDEKGPFLKLDGFGKVRKAGDVLLRSELFRGS